MGEETIRDQMDIKDKEALLKVAFDSLLPEFRRMMALFKKTYGEDQDCGGSYTSSFSMVKGTRFWLGSFDTGICATPHKAMSKLMGMMSPFFKQELYKTPQYTCVRTKHPTKLVVEISRILHDANIKIVSRLMDYEYNPMLGQTILDAIMDPTDQKGSWSATIKCSSCGDTFSVDDALSLPDHFLTQEED